MSEIPRWTPKYLTSWEESGAMRPATHGGYVDYSDHVAAMQAAIPEPKFTVGDVVEWDSFGYKRFAVCQVIFDSKRGEWRYATETAVYFWESSLILYVPPTPEPKMRFNIGDRVVDGKWIGTVKFVTTFESRPTIYTICWDKGGVSDSDSESIVLYVPPVTTCGCPSGYVKEVTAPEAKFKVGDVVVNTKGNSWKVTEVKYVYGSGWRYYSDEPGFDLECYVTLYVPPTTAKFKVGDRVVTKLTTKPWTITTADYVPKWKDWYYEGKGEEGYETDIDLYVPPKPAELIPTLKEHEWVRGTYKTTGIAFGPCTVYFNEIGAMFAGDNNLIHWNTGKISDELATLERCDAPEVK